MSITYMLPRDFVDSLTLWKPEGEDWKSSGNLEQFQLLLQLRDDLQRFKPVFESKTSIFYLILIVSVSLHGCVIFSCMQMVKIL